ncbi:MAG: M67 family metallopeptidase [Sphingomonadales bacterium]
MSVTISSEHAAQIIATADAHPDIEICGLLVGSYNRIDDILPAANVADDTTRRFEIDPAVLFGALRSERAGGGVLIGNYHSHPGGGGTPSETDAAMIRKPGELWLIVARGELSAWRANADMRFDHVALILA